MKKREDGNDEVRRRKKSGKKETKLKKIMRKLKGSGFFGFLDVKMNAGL